MSYRNKEFMDAMKLLSDNGEKINFDLFTLTFYLNLEENKYSALNENEHLRDRAKEGKIDVLFSDIIKSAKDSQEAEKVNSFLNMDYIVDYLSVHTNMSLDYLTEKEDIKIIFIPSKKDELKKPNRLLMVIVYRNKEFTFKSVMSVALSRGNDYENFKSNLERLEHADGTLISMNIRSFHTINTILGIDATNWLLIKIRKKMEEILLPGEYAAQINSDNYVIFMAEIRREVIVHRLNKLTTEIKKLTENQDTLVIQPFYGVIAWDGRSDIEFAYNSANSAKKNIRRQTDADIAFFDYSLAEILKDNKKLEDSFQSALEKKEFEIWFQPRFDAKTEEIIAAEALIRWRNKEGRLLYPDTFIPLFEKNGMIRLLDQYVYEEVCKMQKKRIEENKKVVPVSVNLSRASLYYLDLVEQYRMMAEKIKIDKELVPIEITETAALDMKYIKDIDVRFHQAGFKLQIDDFGAGYSSLSSLLTMHFDTIKLDKSLIDHLGDDRGQRMVYHIIAMAKDMGMHITAEGVEEFEQYISLKNMGCDTIQGYYFSYPLPRDQFEGLLAEM